MSNSQSCSTDSYNFDSRKRKFQIRKIQMMKMFRDSLERRLAAITASIDKLQEQIDTSQTSE